MKKFGKILSLVLVLVMALTAMSVITVSAADQPEKLYLTPNANWKADNARFAAYFFGNGETWVSMTYNSELGAYEVTVPTNKVYPSVIFCRMNPGTTANSWTNKWNQTADLTVPTDGTNHYTVKEGTWDKGGGAWSTIIIDTGDCAHANVTTESKEANCTEAGYKKVYCSDCESYTVNEAYPANGHTYPTNEHVCSVCSALATYTIAGTGAHLGTEWDTGNTANDMVYDPDTGVYTKVYTNVAAGSYQFKCAQDHDWGVAYPSADKTFTVSTAGSTVTITLTGTNVAVEVVAPHVCSFSDPTCTEPGKCSCGATQGEALGHTWTDATCSAPKTCSVCQATEGEALGHTWTDATCETLKTCSVCQATEGELAEHTWVDATCEAPKTCSVCKATEGEAAAHDFKRGACVDCGATDPDYVAPPASPLVMDFTLFEAYPENTYEAGAVQVYNEYFTFIHNAKSRIDGNIKEFEDGFYGTQRFNFGGKTESGKVPTKSALMITVPTSGSVKVWWVSGGNDRLPALLDAEGNVLAQAAESVKDGRYITEFTIPAAGTYYLGNLAGNNYWFQVALTLDAAAECEHEGGTATCLAQAVCTKCGESYGDLAGHTYYGSACLVCGGLNPDYIFNTVVVGENKLVCNEHHLVGDLGPYEFTLFTITEAGHYKFSGTGVGVTIYTIPVGSEGADFTPGTGASWSTWVLTEADLEPGTYYVGFIYAAGVGEYTVTLEKVEEELPHEHVYFDGVCDCGATDPNHQPPVDDEGGNDEDATDAPAEELGFFDMIIKWIMDLIAMIVDFFKF